MYKLGTACAILLSLFLGSCKSEDEKDVARARVTNAVTAISNSVPDDLALHEEFQAQITRFKRACLRSRLSGIDLQLESCAKLVEFAAGDLNNNELAADEAFLLSKYSDASLLSTAKIDAQRAAEDARSSIVAYTVAAHWKWAARFSALARDFDVAVAQASREEGDTVPPNLSFSLLDQSGVQRLKQRIEYEGRLLTTFASQNDPYVSETQGALKALARALNAAPDGSRTQAAVEYLVNEVDNATIAFQSDPSANAFLPKGYQAPHVVNIVSSTLDNFLDQARLFENVFQEKSATKSRSSYLSAEAAARLVDDCSALLGLDEERFDAICGGPILDILASALPPEALTNNGLFPPKGDPNRTDGPDLGPGGFGAIKAFLSSRTTVIEKNASWLPESARQTQVVSLVENITRTSECYAKAAFAGDVTEALRTDAHLELIHENLKIASGGVVPPEFSDPINLLTRDALDALRAENIRLTRIVNNSLNLNPTSADMLVAKGSLVKRLERIDKAIKVQPAREQLAHFLRNIDPEKATALVGAMAEQLPAHIERYTANWAKEFPQIAGELASWKGPRGPPVDSLYPRSHRVLEAIRILGKNNAEAINAFAALRAEHFEFSNSVLAEGGQILQDWKATIDHPRAWMTRLLSPGDLALATQMLSGYATMDGTPATDLRINLADAADEMRKALVVEVERRKALPATLLGYPPGRPPSVVKAAEIYAAEWAKRSPTQAELQFRFVLAQNMFSDVTLAPAEVRVGLRDTVEKVLDDDARRLEGILTKLYGPNGSGNGLLDKAARSVKALPDAELKTLRDVKEKVAILAQLMADRRASAEAAGLVEPSPEKWDRIKTWFWQSGRDPPEASLLGVPRNPRLPSDPSGAALLLGDARIEKGFLELTTAFEVVDHLFESTEGLERRSVVPELVGRQLGRTKASSKLWNNGAFDFDRMVVDKASNRYLDKEWHGFFNADDGNRPFNFDKYVKNATNIRAVGGGIHFGEVATTSEGVEKSISDGASLTYAQSDKTIYLSLSNGKKFRYGPVDPAVVKALYSYVTAYPGINLAVTIGAAGAGRHTSDVDGQSVFLDPHFVDNVVGRDLYLADNLPWALDEEVLANGEANPARGEFRAALRAYRDREERAISSVKALIKGVKPLSRTSTTEWINVAASGNKYHKVALALLRQKRVSDVKHDWIEIEYNDDVQIVARQQGVSKSIVEQFAGEKLRQFAQQAVVNQLAAWNRNGEIPKEVAVLLLLKYAIETAPDAPLAAPVVRLTASTIAEMYAAQKLTPTEEQLAYEVPRNLVEGSGLATLFDTSVFFELAPDGEIKIIPSLRYKYLYNTFRVENNSLVFDFDHSEGKMRILKAFEDAGLTSVANRHFLDLIKHFKPLKNVQDYAALAAFLRWAACPDVTGDTCRVRQGLSIDFSELGSLSLGDGARTRTPDVVLK